MSARFGGAPFVVRPAVMLALAVLASAIALAEYARNFPQLGPRWTLLAAAAVLTACALGIRRGAGWARVLGGIGGVAFGALGLVLPRVMTGQSVRGLDLLLPTIAAAIGVYALLPATRRALERDRPSGSTKAVRS